MRGRMEVCMTRIENRIPLALFAVLALAIGAQACKQDSKSDPTPSKATKGGNAPQEAATPDEVDPRQAKLEAEYSRYAETLITHSAKELGEGERRMLAHLVKVGELVEELHMLQLHPDNLKWRDRLQQSGTEIEKKVFKRFQRPWCGDDDSPDCCALADGPEKRIGAVHWPNDMTDAEFEALENEPNAKELLSPFTVVRRKKDGKGFDAIPYAKTEVFGPRMKQISEELKAAAATAADPGLKKFLLSRAAAFVSDSAFPYDDSDYDWIALSGDWELTLGPYETYKNPRQLKALFEMYLGREDKEISASLGRFKENLQAMENALGELVGPEIYKSRKLDPRISIRAVDVWLAAGDGRRDRGVTAAFHLPNRGKSVDEGLYKKVMLVNHQMAFEPIVQARAKLILAPSQRQFVDIRTDIVNTTFHEFAHGFGAYHEMEVTTPKGDKTTVKQALRELDSLFEEEKADTFGMWLLAFQRQQGWVDEAEVKKRTVSALMHLVGLFQYPLPGTYTRMVAIQLGHYLDEGALSWDAKAGHLEVHFDKMPAAVESLAKKVATIQLTGDYAGARALYDRYVSDEGEKKHSLKGTLAEVRKVMMEKFQKAGVKSPSLLYEVTGL